MQWFDEVGISGHVRAHIICGTKVATQVLFNHFSTTVRAYEVMLNATSNRIVIE